MSTKAPEVVILGGGSAGWIAACLLHRQWAARGARITLIESPDVPIIGVGEGSTPQLKAFFDHLGIAEDEWMDRCEATYKLGIRFTGWSERVGFESYFHPFPGPVDLHTQEAFFRNCTLARRGFDVPAHPDRFFLAARLAEEGKKPFAAPNFPFEPSYGYHFNAHRLGEFLGEWARARGVGHVEARIARVERAENGDVAALVSDRGERFEADLFVDCSGFRALIAQETLGVPFRSYADGLFNDSALVIATQANKTFKPQTEAVVMRAGWRWSIPLQSRIGNGYVYSSRHISHEEAEAELRAALGLGEPGGDQGNPPARRLTMKVGRVENSWERNCLALGLAQGFIEPLEATALHIVITSVLEFARAFEAGGFTPQHRARFNEAIALRYDAIRDYIVAHYRMNQRSDSAYWRECAANQALSDALRAMITAWFTHGDIARANAELYPIEAYNAASWHCLFAGYGTFPAREKMRPGGEAAGQADLQEVDRIVRASAQNFG